MNVACPNCSAQFRLPDSALAAGPRKVRCGKCGHVWAASRQSAVAAPAPASARAHLRAAPAVAAPGLGTVPPQPPPPPPRAAQAAMSQAPAPKAPARAERRGGSLWIWWLLLLVVIAALAAGAWFGRSWLVEQWPPATRFYDWVGIDLPRIEIVELKEETAGEGATHRRTVGGVLANHADTALPVPPLLFTLYDAEGAPVNQWLEPPPVATLGPGETAPFTSSVGIAGDGSWDVVLQREAVEAMEAPGAAGDAGDGVSDAGDGEPADAPEGEAAGDSR